MVSGVDQNSVYLKLDEIVSFARAELFSNNRFEIAHVTFGASNEVGRVGFFNQRFETRFYDSEVLHDLRRDNFVRAVMDPLQRIPVADKDKWIVSDLGQKKLLGLLERLPQPSLPLVFSVPYFLSIFQVHLFWEEADIAAAMEVGKDENDFWFFIGFAHAG